MSTNPDLCMSISLVIWSSSSPCCVVRVDDRIIKDYNKGIVREQCGPGHVAVGPIIVWTYGVGAIGSKGTRPTTEVVHTKFRFEACFLDGFVEFHLLLHVG